MVASLSKILLLVALLCNISGGNSDIGESACLQVPQSKFSSAVKSTIGAVRQVASAVSTFSTKISADFRLSNAVSDCIDLMDFTEDQLSWSLSASLNPSGKDNSTGNVIADMKTWLGCARTNQDTCREGFDGTNNSVVKSLIFDSLDKATTSVHSLLNMVKPNPTAATGGRSGSRKLITNRQFPHWLKPHDRKLLQTVNGTTADVVVAADGTGDFRSIVQAVAAAPDYNRKRFVIYIKRGVYREYVEIGKKKVNIMMIGDGMSVTVISGNRSHNDGWKTYRTATFGVKGQGFIARDMTFENTAGPENYQAVAFRSDSDMSVLYRCAIMGYQDTLYAHCMRQFYKECLISGTVDFIFGDGTVVFQNCQILGRKGLPNQKNTVTAQGRTWPVEESGFSIQFCNISTEPGVSVPMYLGRPWKLYSRTVIMQSYLGSAIKPEGWLEMDGSFALDTLFYGEYMNYGPGAGLGARVKWFGYHAFSDSSQANKFTVAQFIMGNNWLPTTGVKYTAGLTV